MLSGFVNVHKPVGATASDVVVMLRQILKEKQIGHLGTLDPGACGVLPIAIGKATKLFNFLTDKRKTYRAFFTFGKTSDTLDSYGVITQRSDVLPTEKAILEALPGFCGEIRQTPPQYSAISVNGTRAYELARSGIEVELKKRTVTIFDFQLNRKVSDHTFMFDIECSAGTYIRSLARDLANSVGSVGYMSGLIRLQSGCFGIEHSLTIDEIQLHKENCVQSLMYPLEDLAEVKFDDKLFDKLCNGVKIPCSHFEGYAKIFCKGEFFGLGSCKDGKISLDYYLKNA